MMGFEDYWFDSNIFYVFVRSALYFLCVRGPVRTLVRVRRARPDLPILDATSELNSANFLSGNISGGLQTTESKIIKNPVISMLRIVSRSQGLNGFTIWSLFFEISRNGWVSWTTDCANPGTVPDSCRRYQTRAIQRLSTPLANPIDSKSIQAVVLLRFRPHRA